ncbi:MAG: hypothetical protein FWG87_04965 [Defluviitaleaceae bacterium]|nr:hypothetical protein [Defluviitaleaceae bacterium]
MRGFCPRKLLNGDIFSHERIRVNLRESAKSVFDLHVLASCVCRGVSVNCRGRIYPSRGYLAVR